MSLWSELLQFASSTGPSGNCNAVEQNTTDSADRGCNIVVLGDRGSGKSTLLASLQGTDDDGEARDGVALGYTYFDLIDAVAESDMDIANNEQDAVRASAWVLEGDPAHANLLALPLRGRLTPPPSEGLNTVPPLVAVIVLDLSTPWTLMDQLARWAGALQRAVAGQDDGLAGGSQVPGHSSSERSGSHESANQSTELPGLSASASVRQGFELRVKQLCSTWASGSRPADASAPAEQSSISNGHTDDQQQQVQSNGLTRDHLGSRTSGDPADSLVLPEGWFAKHNFGFPVILVGSKCDAQDELRRTHGYTDDTLEFIEESLRQEAISHGAALIYTSSKEGSNINLLRHYIAHLMYPRRWPWLVGPKLTGASSDAQVNHSDFIANQTADISFSERRAVGQTTADVLFVPLGWDSAPKIRSGATHFFSDPDATFQTIVTPPSNYSTAEQATIDRPSGDADSGTKVPDFGPTDEQFLASLKASTVPSSSSASPSSSTGGSSVQARSKRNVEAGGQSATPPANSDGNSGVAVTPTKSGSISGTRKLAGTPSTPAPPTSKGPPSVRTPSGSSKSSSSPSATPPPTQSSKPATPTTTPSSKPAVLANFFSSLAKSSPK